MSDQPSDAGMDVESYPVPLPRGADTVAPLIGRKVALRPIVPSDYDFLYQIATSPDVLVGWRHRGAAPPPEQYAQVLWQGVLAQFLAVRKDDGKPIGAVSAYNADLRNQCVSLAVLIAPEFERRGWAMEAGFIFIDYLFKVWNFRKIYLESLEFNVRSFWSGVDKLFRVEGCLRDHEYHDGKYWHLYFLAIYREEWAQAAPRVLPASVVSPEDSDQ